jgi:hypothetical protein
LQLRPRAAAEEAVAEPRTPVDRKRRRVRPPAEPGPPAPPAAAWEPLVPGLPIALPISAVETPAPRTSAPLAGRPLSELLPDAPGPPPPAPGLFAASARRALLGGVSAVRAREGDIDVDAVVEVLGARRPLAEIPLEWIETTRGELQLLLDTGVAMDPYREDVDRLPDELARVVGEDGLKLRWFEDCPTGSAGVFGPTDDEPAPYRLPAARTRLLAVTVFGLRGPLGAPPAAVEGWRRLARACRRRGVPLLVLTPLPPYRRPRGLGPHLAAVTWDRATGVRDVGRAVRKARAR